MRKFATAIVSLGFLCAPVKGFIVNYPHHHKYCRNKIQHINERLQQERCPNLQKKLNSATTTTEEEGTPDTATPPLTATDDAIVDIDPKDAVKIFGRLAEKYIMLDESGGMCCYSACKDCEYRLPGGGYRMADQSASRPKWIPTYGERSFAGQNKEHLSKWKTVIFSSDDESPSNNKRISSGVTKTEFVESVAQLDFATPLGGPFVSKSAGSTMDDTSTAAVEHLFDVLTEGKTEKLTCRKMSRRFKVLSNNEEGLTWPNFSAALGIS